MSYECLKDHREGSIAYGLLAVPRCLVFVLTLDYFTTAIAQCSINNKLEDLKSAFYDNTF